MMRQRRFLVALVTLVTATSWLIVAPVAAVSEVVDTARISIPVGGGEGDDGSYDPAISGDASVVAYDSDASNLVAADSNDEADIFLSDIETGVTSRVSVTSGGQQSDGSSFAAALSDDGSTIAYYSLATNLVTGDTNLVSDVFVYNVVTGTTTRASVASDGTQSDLGSFDPSISGDGSLVAFVSDATNLVSGDTNGLADVFLHDVATLSLIHI